MLVFVCPWGLPSHPPAAGAPPEGEPLENAYRKRIFLEIWRKRLPLWGSSREAGERANEKTAMPFLSNSSKNPNLPSSPSLAKHCSLIFPHETGIIEKTGRYLPFRRSSARRGGVTPTPAIQPIHRPYRFGGTTVICLDSFPYPAFIYIGTAGKAGNHNHEIHP